VDKLEQEGVMKWVKCGTEGVACAYDLLCHGSFFGQYLIQFKPQYGVYAARFINAKDERTTLLSGIERKNNRDERGSVKVYSDEFVSVDEAKAACEKHLDEMIEALQKARRDENLYRCRTQKADSAH